MYGTDYFIRNIPENWFIEYNLIRPDQLAAFCYAFGLPFWGDEGLERRKPEQVYSIGCGVGTLEAYMETYCPVIGVDPTEGARNLYKGSQLIDNYEGGGDTLIFCESIEHIERSEIDRILSLVPNGARVIIVNWLSHHPLNTNGFDHITRIDDQFFDEISSRWKVLVRNRSHLVMEKSQ